MKKVTPTKRLFEVEVVETVLKKVIVLAHSEETLTSRKYDFAEVAPHPRGAN